MLMKKINVGFIGLGLMGLPMAKNILKKKYPLIVWNRSKKNIKKIKKVFSKNYQPYQIGFISREKSKVKTFGKLQW